MKELGSSSKTTDGENIQDRRAKETHKTRGDATTEQTSSEAGAVRRKTIHFTADRVFHSSKEKSAFAKDPSDQDAKTEQPSPESGGVWQQLAQYAQYAKNGSNLLGKAVVYTALARAVVEPTIRPADAKDLSNNDRNALNSYYRDEPSRYDHDPYYRDEPRRYDHDPYYRDEPRRYDRDSWHSEREPGSRRGSGDVNSLSRYTGRGHDEFSHMVRIGDREFVRPTTDDVAKDIKALLQDKKFPDYLEMLCKKPRSFANLLKSDAFLDMIHPLYLDENVQDFMRSLCDDPRRREGFLELAEQVSSNLEKKHMDAIRNRFGYDDGYDKKRETDHPPLQTKHRQEHETVLMRTIQNMQDIMKTMLKNQHTKDEMQYEKDKMWMEQNESDKGRFSDSREKEKSYARKLLDQFALSIVLGAAVLGVYKCMKKPAEAEERQEHPHPVYMRGRPHPVYMRGRPRPVYVREQQEEIVFKNPQGVQHGLRRTQREMVFEDLDDIRQVNQRIDFYMQDQQNIQEGRIMRNSSRIEKQPRIDFNPGNRLKIEEIEEEGSKSEDKEKKLQIKEKQKEKLKKQRQKNMEIFNNEDMLKNLFREGEVKQIEKLIKDVGGSVLVMKKLFELKSRRVKDRISKDVGVRDLFTKNEEVLSWIRMQKDTLDKIQKCWGEDVKKEFEASARS